MKGMAECDNPTADDQTQLFLSAQTDHFSVFQLVVLVVPLEHTLPVPNAALKSKRLAPVIANNLMTVGREPESQRFSSRGADPEVFPVGSLESWSAGAETRGRQSSRWNPV